MIYVAGLLALALVLTVWFGKMYIDSIKDERKDDVYEKGWSNGYRVAMDQFEGKKQDAWNAGYDYRKKQEAAEKKPVKKKSVKKISTKEN